MKKYQKTQQHKEFNPFYQVMADRISAQLRIPVLGILFASCVPGILFFVIHYMSTAGITFINDEYHFHKGTWVIGLMIIMAAICLYYATNTLKGLFLHIDSASDSQQKKTYIDPLNRTLSNRNFVLAGLFFGTLNALMGNFFGVPYQIFAAQASIYTGFFLVGFVCGMPAWGIYGVLVVMNILSKDPMFRLDYTAPDGCGGTQFLGKAFVKFSTVTLIMGVIISIYILFTWWASHPTILVMVAIGAWITFPYLLSIVVLVVPAVSINRMC